MESAEPETDEWGLSTRKLGNGGVVASQMCHKISDLAKDKNIAGQTMVIATYAKTGVPAHVRQLKTSQSRRREAGKGLRSQTRGYSARRMRTSGSRPSVRSGSGPSERRRTSHRAASRSERCQL